MMIPISPIIRNVPKPDKSFLVVYPYKLRPANAAEVIKNTRATLAPVNVKKIVDKEAPIVAAKSQKTICAVDDLILCRPKLNNKTNAKGASITIHLKPEANIVCPKLVKPTICPASLVTIAICAIRTDTTPVRATPDAI